jgi:hypothetical protein
MNISMDCLTCCRGPAVNKVLEDDRGDIELTDLTKPKKPAYLLLSMVRKQYRAIMILENRYKEWPQGYSYGQFLIDAEKIAKKAGSVEPLVKAYTRALPKEVQPHVYPKFSAYRKKWATYKLEVHPDVLNMEPIELMLHALKAKISATQSIQTRYIIEFAQKMNHFYGSYYQIHQIPKCEFMCERVRTMSPDWELLNLLYAGTDQHRHSFRSSIYSPHLTDDQWVCFTSLPCDIQCRFCDCVCVPGSPYHYALSKEKFPQVHKRDQLAKIRSDLKESEKRYEKKQHQYKEEKERLLRVKDELMDLQKQLLTECSEAKNQYTCIRKEYMQAKTELTWHSLFDSTKDTGDDPEDFI